MMSSIKFTTSAIQSHLLRGQQIPDTDAVPKITTLKITDTVKIKVTFPAKIKQESSSATVDKTQFFDVQFFQNNEKIDGLNILIANTGKNYQATRSIETLIDWLQNNPGESANNLLKIIKGFCKSKITIFIANDLAKIIITYPVLESNNLFFRLQFIQNDDIINPPTIYLSEKPEIHNAIDNLEILTQYLKISNQDQSIIEFVNLIKLPQIDESTIIKTHEDIDVLEHIHQDGKSTFKNTSILKFLYSITTNPFKNTEEHMPLLNRRR